MNEVLSMIHTENLTRIFRIKDNTELVAVDRLSIDVQAGEVFGFLGPNGAGKTTTIRMLTCLIAPTQGTATINGYTVGVDNQTIRKSVGILTETPGMYERLSAAYNLRIFANLYGISNPEAQIAKYLQMMGLWERRDEEVAGFSKGMRQKLALARALLHEPQILFLDEPTAGLDPEAAHMVRDFIAELRDQGRTIFLCTHNLDEADRLCDHIAVFKTRLIAMDTPTNLRRRLFSRQVVFHLRALDPAFITTVKSLPFVEDVQAIDNKLVVRLHDPEQYNPAIIRSLIAAGADIQFVGELRYTLEDVYLQLVQNNPSLN